MLLSAAEKESALIIPRTLFRAQELCNVNSPTELVRLSRDYFATGTLELEYLEIIDGATLQPLSAEWSDNAVMCIAAYCGPVRLIDNLALN
jgi:pantothenate synthetase